MIWKMVAGPKDWYTFLKTTKQTDNKQCFCLFGVKVQLCSPDCPGIHDANPCGFKGNAPASAAQALGLQCMPQCSDIERMIFKLSKCPENS